jgi:hypothetical protein
MMARELRRFLIAELSIRNSLLWDRRHFGDCISAFSTVFTSFPPFALFGHTSLVCRRLVLFLNGGLGGLSSPFKNEQG